MICQIFVCVILIGCIQHIVVSISGRGAVSTRLTESSLVFDSEVFPSLLDIESGWFFPGWYRSRFHSCFSLGRVPNIQLIYPKSTKVDARRCFVLHFPGFWRDFVHIWEWVFCTFFRYAWWSCFQFLRFPWTFKCSQMICSLLCNHRWWA